MGNLFSSKKQTSDYSNIYDPFSSLRGSATDWLKSQIGKTATPYQGELVAPSTPQEKQSLDYLNKYVNEGLPESLGLAKEEISKTLKGEYDPTTSPYYQAVKAESARNLEDALEGISSDAAGAGRYWTGARLGEQGTARTDIGIALNKLLGGMAETERGRRLQAVPYATNIGQYEQELPLQKATALQSIGGLERNLSQGLNEAVYNEWLRQQQYPIQMAQLAQPYATYSPTFAQAGYSPSTFNQFMPFLAQGASKLLQGFATPGGKFGKGGSIIGW